MLKQNVNMNKLFITLLFTLVSSVSISETINSQDTYVYKGLIYKKGIHKPFTGIVEGNSVGRLIEGKREGRGSILRKEK